MHLEILVEEPSAKNVVEILLNRMMRELGEHTFSVHEFGGKHRLLKNLDARLRGYAHWMPNDWHIVVLVDADNEDCRQLKMQLVKAAREAGLAHRVLNRIVVEELEAWFFGDVDALRSVYPRIPLSLAHQAAYRDPDAIAGGTWEALDRLLIEYSYPQGLIKTEASAKIAKYMDPARNRSQSFRAFYQGILNILSK
jgi:hypothetical protein